MKSSLVYLLLSIIFLAAAYDAYQNDVIAGVVAFLSGALVGLFFTGVGIFTRFKSSGPNN